MARQVRRLVSKQKRRFMEDGFDLDLTYICPNILAMGFPSENIEGFYRNSMEEVIRFLDLQHGSNYKVYNLCAERTYDISKFYGRVARFPFEDHNTPPFELIGKFCVDVCKYLDEDDRNVAAIHCKAGKGRTGTMISCYLMHTQRFSRVPEALEYFGAKRTQNAKGVTIPSQRRYVEYYGYLLHHKLFYNPATVLLTNFVFEGQANFSNLRTPQIYFVIKYHGALIHTSRVYTVDLSQKNRQTSINLKDPIPLCGDFKVEFFILRVGHKEKMFHFWLNTFFVEKAPLYGDELLFSTQTSVLNGKQVLTPGRGELTVPRHGLRRLSIDSSRGVGGGGNRANDFEGEIPRRRSLSLGQAQSLGYVRTPDVTCSPDLAVRDSSHVMPEDWEKQQASMEEDSSDTDIHCRGKLLEPLPCTDLDGRRAVVSLPKHYIDKANKDHRHFESNFRLHCVFALLVDAHTPVQPLESKAISPSQVHADAQVDADSGETDTEDEDENAS